MWEQLEEKLKPLRNFNVPESGWVKVIRKSFGLTINQLAKRCDLSNQRIARIEHDERLKKTTLETLEKVADRLECRLVYAFVPKEPIEGIIEKQARRKALGQLEEIAHSMALEDQAIGDKANKKQFKLLVDELKTTRIKEIWD